MRFEGNRLIAHEALRKTQHYLPGKHENCPFLLAACSVLFMLDRTPSIELWDSFFFDRWTLLNTQANI
jgi:hypothetical protein